MYSRNVALILMIMVASIREYWDEECFRLITVSKSFGEVQRYLHEVDLRRG